VHLGGAGLAQHLDHRPRGGAPHDGVVDDHQRLPSMFSRSGLSFMRTAEGAQLLARGDEVRPM
jgi:hypothetical protein